LPIATWNLNGCVLGFYVMNLYKILQIGEMKLEEKAFLRHKKNLKVSL